MLKVIAKKILYLLPFLFIGCSTPEKKKSLAPVEQIYRADFEKVWRAAQIALANYPIQVNNMDTGVLETQFLSGADKWKPPFAVENNYNGNRYKIVLRVVRGHWTKQNKKRRAITKVSIQKIIEKQKDYFADAQRMPSDGLEEESILYRIGRELLIDRALEKAAQEQNE